jgi:hypothetical protein
LFDHGVQNVGEFGQTIGTRDQVRVQLAEITPARGGIIAIGSASLKLESLIAEDESAQLWVVIRV